MRALSTSSVIERVDVAAYEFPLPYERESDATLEWDKTTMVVAEVHGNGERGLGYTFADASLVPLIGAKLAPVVEGRNALAVEQSWRAMYDAVRNLGNQGLTQFGIAAVDVALWDLKARLLEVPVSVLLGRFHDWVPVYASGGFTSYPLQQLQDELRGFIERGIPRVKMKVGRDPGTDLERVQAARKVIGDDVELYVDANGGYGVGQARAMAQAFADFGVSWFEEPVSSDNLLGLRFLREHSPVGMDIAAGEYGTTIEYFHNMLAADCVDVLQADVSRCGGFTGFLRVAALARAFHVPLSAHTAPQLDAHVCGAAETLRHAEYFVDHMRVAEALFDGVLEPVEGALQPDLSRVGHGLELRRDIAERYLVAGGLQ